MRNLKLADRSVITATTPYDQYDFYFAHICKINDYVAGLDGQAADRKCVSHFSSKFEHYFDSCSEEMYANV